MSKRVLFQTNQYSINTQLQCIVALLGARNKDKEGIGLNKYINKEQ